jgi:hypothetical protein
MVVLKEGIEQLRKRLKTGCTIINQNIGHSLFHSFSGVAIPRYTGGLVDGHLTI